MGNGDSKFKNRETLENVGEVTHVLGRVKDIRYDKFMNRTKDPSQQNFVHIEDNDGKTYRAIITRNAPFMQIANRCGFQASTWNNPDRLVGKAGVWERGRTWPNHSAKISEMRLRILSDCPELLFKIVRQDKNLLAVLSPIYADITTDVVKPTMASLFPNMNIETIIEPDGIFGGRFRGRVNRAQNVESYISVDATQLDGNVGLRLYSDIRIDNVIFTVKETELLKNNVRSTFYARPFHTGDPDGNIPRLKKALEEMARSLDDVYKYVVDARDRKLSLEERQKLLSHYAQFFSKKIAKALAFHDLFAKPGDESLYKCALIFAKLASRNEIADGVALKLQGYAGEMIILAGMPTVLNDVLNIVQKNDDLWSNN
jgi:hypothetical protein